MLLCFSKTFIFKKNIGKSGYKQSGAVTKKKKKMLKLRNAFVFFENIYFQKNNGNSGYEKKQQIETTNKNSKEMPISKEGIRTCLH